MKNILFSTTCQWNPGDEFILHGVLNIVRSSGLQFNPLLYNRNPVVSPKRPPAPEPSIQGQEHLWENTFDVENPVPVDYVIFAGTPEWTGPPRVGPLLEFIKANNLRCSFLGVGLSEPETPSSVLATILEENTDVFVARDRLAFEMASKVIEPQIATCPSILCSRVERLRTGPKRIGCGIQGSRMQWHRISARDQAVLYQCYARLARTYSVEYIAHYIDDLASVPAGAQVHYSGLSADYYSIYDRCDVLISPRVHGCGIAASLGIPSICLAHDRRGAAAELFGSLVVTSPENLDALIEQHDWKARSQNVLEIKRKTAAFYQLAIRPLLESIAKSNRSDERRVSCLKPNRFASTDQEKIVPRHNPVKRVLRRIVWTGGDRAARLRRFGRNGVWALGVFLKHGRPSVVLHFGIAPGDDLLCTVVLRELKKRGFPKNWMVSNYPELFEGNKDVSRVVPLDQRLESYSRAVGAKWQLLEYAKVDLEQDMSVFPQRHVIAELCARAGILGEIVLRPYLTLTEREVGSADWAQGMIAIQSSGLSAAYPMLNKQWSVERFQEVVAGLKNSFRFVQLGSADDPALGGVTDLRGKTRIRETAAVLANSRLYIGGEGFLMHLARAVECPSVIILGGRTAPGQVSYTCNINLYSSVPCAPCGRWNRCDNDRVCMRNITATHVRDAVEELVQRPRQPLIEDKVSI